MRWTTSQSGAASCRLVKNVLLKSSSRQRRWNAESRWTRASSTATGSATALTTDERAAYWTRVGRSAGSSKRSLVTQLPKMLTRTKRSPLGSMQVGEGAEAHAALERRAANGRVAQGAQLGDALGPVGRLEVDGVGRVAGELRGAIG